MVHFSFSRRGLGCLWAAGLALLAASGSALFAQTKIPTANDGFDPNVTGSVAVVALQPNGQILVGGNFTALQPNGVAASTPRNNLARLNADGSLDTTFNPNPNGQVISIAVQTNGQIIIGGYFSSVQPNGAGTATPIKYLARLNADGSLDTTFNPNPVGTYNAEVNAICLEPNGQILIGGAFTSLQPGGTGASTAIPYLARLNANGSIDTTFKPTPNAQVDAIYVQPNGAILIGGGFTTLQPDGTATVTAETFLARLNNDGTIDSSFNNPSPNNQVATITMQRDGEILIGGAFTTVQYILPGSGSDSGTNVDFIARLNPNGNLDPNFPTNSGGPIRQIVVQADGKILLAGTVGTLTWDTSSFFNAYYLARINPNGTPDESFFPSPNYTVYGIALQSDGKIVLGGAFNQLQPNSALGATTRNGLARVNTDGSLDENFDPNAFGGVGAVCVDSNGKYLVGGAFSSINGQTRTNLARLNADGTLDTSFAPTPNGTVSAIAVQANGQIIIGGNFTYVNSIGMNYLARLNSDGSLDTSFNPGPAGAVYAVVVQPTDGKILVGGAFFGFNPIKGPQSATVQSIAYLGRVNTDGTIDTTFQPDPNNNVYSIVFNASNDTILFAGAFTAFAPIDFSNQDAYYTDTNPYIGLIGAGNGLGYVSFVPNPNGQVNSIALQSDGKILLCGAFTTLQPNPTTTTQVVNGVVVTTYTPLSPRNYIARINADGSLDQNFSPPANAPALSIAVNPTNGQVVVGGTFTTVSNTTHDYIVRLDSDGTVDGGFEANLNGPVDTVLYLPNNQFLAGGSFTTVLPAGATTPTAAQHVVRFNGDGSVDATFQSEPFTTTPVINCVAVQQDNKIVIGGNFISIAGVYATNIVRFNSDDSQDVTFIANANSTINSIVEDTDGSFFVGGTFTGIGNAFPVNNFAHLTSTGIFDPTYAKYPDGPVNAIAAQTNVPVVIGGSFAHVGTFAVANLARIQTNGSVDTTFTPNPNAAVSVIVTEPNGQYLVGGSFTTIDGTGRNYLARLNPNGSLDAGFNPSANAAVNVILIQPDGKILIGGAFTSIAGSGRNYIARLNADGSLDTTFNPGANGAVQAMVLQAPGPGAATNQGASSVDQILVGGAFTSIDGTARNYLARLNYDGSLDATFNPAPDGRVTALAIQLDGKPIVAGAFANIGGVPRNGLARLADPEGTTQVLTVSPDLSSATIALTGGPELSNTTFEWSTDDASWVTLGFGARVGTANTWKISNLSSLPSGSFFYMLVVGQSFSSSGSSTSIIGSSQQFYIVATPTIQSAGAATAATGAPFYYEIAATNSPTSYSATGLAPGLSFNPATGVISGTPVLAGTYTASISASTAGGTATTSLVITVAPSGSSGAAVAPLSRLVNLSTRSLVSTANPLIAGFGIAGTGPKTVLLRAVGPGLAPTFGIANYLSNPYLMLYDSGGQLMLVNEGWSGSGSLMQIFAEFGAFPLTVGSADSAVVTTLSPGNYTMNVIDGAGTGGTALAEIYDADSNPLALTQRLTNISGRGVVYGATAMIGGFAITGSVPKDVLIRAVGPGLTSTFGLPNTLVTPQLSIYNGQGTLIAQNSVWGTPTTVNASYPAASPSAIAAAATTAGAFPFVTGSADSAVVLALPPGTYTGQITGLSNAAGTALFEIYELP